MKFILLAASLLLAQVGQIPSWPPVQSGPAAGGYTGPGDIVSGARGWWGIRGYNGAFSGNAINACLPLDATCTDVPIVSGNLSAGILTTLGCNNSTAICTVKILYDQSGNSNTLTQATIADRATLVVAGAANGCSTTSLPCLKYVSTTFYQTTTFNGTANIAAPDTLNAVYNFSGGSTTAPTIFGGYSSSSPTSNNTSIFSDNGSANNFGVYCSGPYADLTGVTDGSWYAVHGVCATGSGTAYANGSSTSASATSGPFYGVGTVITGQIPGGGSQFTGYINEFGVWAVAFTSTQVTNVTSNQRTYWGF